jgi:hypothetical protein
MRTQMILAATTAAIALILGSAGGGDYHRMLERTKCRAKRKGKSS